MPEYTVNTNETDFVMDDKGRLNKDVNPNLPQPAEDFQDPFAAGAQNEGNSPNTGATVGKYFR